MITRVLYMLPLLMVLPTIAGGLFFFAVDEAAGFNFWSAAVAVVTSFAISAWLYFYAITRITRPGREFISAMERLIENKPVDAVKVKNAMAARPDMIEAFEQLQTSFGHVQQQLVDLNKTRTQLEEVVSQKKSKRRYFKRATGGFC